MQLPEHPKSSRSVSEEQWSVVERSQESGNDLAHHWRLVQLRSNRGRLRPGLQCVDCHMVQVLTERQLLGTAGYVRGGSKG